MNFSKTLILSSAFLSIAAISSATPVVPATTTFAVSGTFANGAALSGSFDVTNGQISNADMTIGGIGGVFTLVRNGGGASDEAGVWEDVTLNDNGAVLTLNLKLQKGATSLGGYNGGQLCNVSNNCVDDDDVTNFVPAPNFGNGGRNGAAVNLTAGGVAPEPGSFALIGAGLSAIGVAFRRRFVKK